MNWPLVVLVGAGVGFLGGLLGKGGSAIATPLLHAIGVPAIVAVAAPLPASIPSTLASGWVYARRGLVDWRVVRWSVGAGVPATVAGSVATRWVGGDALVLATDVVLVGLGLRLLLAGTGRASAARDGVAADGVAADGAAADGVAGIAVPVVTGPEATRPVGESLPPGAVRGTAPPAPAVARRPAEAAGRAGRPALVAVALVVGLVSGLLANSGGFLLAPLYLTVLRLPMRTALASSLAVAAVLATPATVVHAGLGHVDWTLAVVFALSAMPLSIAGARVGLRIDPARLERGYGAALVALGAAFAAVR